MSFVLDGEVLDWRQDLSIASSKIDANLTDKDVKIDLSAFGADFWDNVKADGGDIRASLSDGTTRIPLSVHNIDTGAETGYARVKVSSISSSTNTKIFIFWGNAALSQPAAGTTYGSNNVWDSDFTFVLDFELVPASGAVDLTGNGYSFTEAGSMTAGDLVPSINGAEGWDLDGTNDYANRANNANYDCKSTVDFTIEVFNKTDASAKGAGKDTMLYVQDDSAGGASRDLFIMRYFRDIYQLSIAWGDVAAGETFVLSTTAADSLAWRHAAFTHEAGSPATGICYFNGVNEDSTTYASAWDASNDAPGVNIGAQATSLTHSMAGIVDEARRSGVVRSAAWLKATSENLGDLSNFYTLGTAEQTIGSKNHACVGGLCVTS